MTDSREINIEGQIVDTIKMRGISTLVLLFLVFVGLHIGLESLSRLNDDANTVSLWYPPAGLIFATIIYFRSLGAAMVFCSSLIGFFIFRDPQYPVLDGLGYITLMILNILFWRGIFVRLGMIGPQLMQKPRWALGLVLLATLVSIGNAALGIGALWIAGIVEPTNFLSTYTRYFLGEYIGLISIAPLLVLVIFPLLLRARRPKTEATWKWLRALLIYSTISLIGVFLVVSAGPEYKLRLVYLGSLPVLFAAIGGRIRETCVAVFLFTLTTAVALAFTGRQIELDLSLYLILIILVAFVVATAISSQRSTAQSLTAALAQRDELTSSQRELGARITHLQKMEALGTLAGGMAHELNNLLQPILTFARAAETAPPEQAREYLGRVRECAQSARILVKDVLQFSRPQDEIAKLPLPLIALPVILPDALAIAREVLPARVILHAPSDIPDIRVAIEPEKLTQILMNVLRNASDALPTGGNVYIAAELAQRALDVASDATDWLKISITDTGLGMDPQTKIRAIDPFFTTKVIGRGNGLGLSTVHGIMRAWGGHIDIISAPGAGATINLWIPRASVA
jgi:signal transduction histidine kinase